MAMDPWRFISLYIGFTPIGIFFGIMGYIILKRDPKDRLNQVLSAFYFLILTSLIINLIYSIITIPSLQELVNFMSILATYILMFSFSLLVLFTILLYKPERMAKSKNQLAFLLIYGGLLSFLFIIPDGINVQILTDGTQLSPVWNLPFTLYNTFFLITTECYILYISNKIYKHFTNTGLAKRFKFFFIGVIIYYSLSIELIISHFLNLYFLRQLHTISMVVLVFGSYFIYYSIGTKLKIPINIRVSIEEEPVFKVKELT